MPAPSLRLSDANPLSFECDVLVVGVQKTKAGPRLLLMDPELEGLQESLVAIGVTGASDEFFRIPAPAGVAKSLALIGVGESTTEQDLRNAAGSATRQIRGAEHVAIALPAHDEGQLLAVLTGAALGAYTFTAYRTELGDNPKNPATVVTALSEVSGAHLVARAEAEAVAVHTVRDLVNMPPSDLYPESFADRALELAQGLPVTVTVLSDHELEAGGYGGILGVGRGSVRGPRLVKVEFSPTGAKKMVALVGKGITFDSGGLSLKPPASMIGMKYDMTGAATVLAVVLAVAKLALPVKVTAWLCLAENMPSGSASRPNDVLRIRGGKTVEVLNTDAEGRLVLADGLVAASEENPDAIIDVATLTGAAVVALGHRYVPTMGNEQLVKQLVDVSARVGESFWPMPLPADVRAMLASDIADIANVKPGNTAAGMLLGGVFLQEFVGKVSDEPNAARIPWAHLDIAGPANNSNGAYWFNAKGPTGVTVRTLIALAEEFSLA